MKITATISLLCSLLLSANVSADSRTPEQIIEQTSSEVLTLVNQQADRIRNELLAQGIELIDKSGGLTEWIQH